MLLYSYSAPGAKLGGWANAMSSSCWGFQTLVGSSSRLVVIAGESVKLYSPLRISSSWAIVMLSPLGTSGMYFVTGSSRLSLPS